MHARGRKNEPARKTLPPAGCHGSGSAGPWACPWGSTQRFGDLIQWLIIQGREPAKDLAPSAATWVLLDLRPPEQQPQFMPWPARELRGSLALRSFAARARFTADDSAEMAGAPPTMRSEDAPHCGQSADRATAPAAAAPRTRRSRRRHSHRWA